MGENVVNTWKSFEFWENTNQSILRHVNFCCIFIKLCKFSAKFKPQNSTQYVSDRIWLDIHEVERIIRCFKTFLKVQTNHKSEIQQKYNNNKWKMRKLQEICINPNAMFSCGQVAWIPTKSKDDCHGQVWLELCTVFICFDQPIAAAHSFEHFIKQEQNQFTNSSDKS